MGSDVFITGGAGYCGSALVPRLMAAGHRVTVFGSLRHGRDVLPPDGERLEVIAGDIRDTAHLAAAVAGHDVFINLACISSDITVDSEPDVAEEVNVAAFGPMVAAAKAAGIRRFVHASSSSVYGLPEQPDVTEAHSLQPITRYNAQKAQCEAMFWPFCDDGFVGVIFRPATVCGHAPNVRWNISVNLLTRNALEEGRITVHGGAQTRPFLHVDDYCTAAMLLADAPAHLVQRQVFNVGAENLSIADVATRIKAVIDAEAGLEKDVCIETVPVGDARSYRLTSDKIKRILHFHPRLTTRDAIASLVRAWRHGRYSSPARTPATLPQRR